MRSRPSLISRVRQSGLLQGEVQPRRYVVKAQAAAMRRRYRGPAMPADASAVMSQTQRDLIAQSVADGSSFVDVACMFHADGAAAFLAEASGSKRVTATDIDHASAVFEARAQGSQVRYVRADVNAAEALEAIGHHDVVYCCGLMYHVPDPHHTLQQLKAMAGSTLIVGTKSVPPIPGFPGAVTYFPALSDQQRADFNSIYDPESLAFKGDRPLTANWFWGLTAEVMTAMIEDAEWTVTQVHRLPWTGRYDDLVLVARRISS
jgi:SAM-dependent methyltransferase